MLVSSFTKAGRVFLEELYADQLSCSKSSVAATLTVVVAFGSDRTKLRGPWMLACLPLSIAGYALIRTTTNNNVKYGALFLIASGLYTSVPPVLVWIKYVF